MPEIKRPYLNHRFIYVAPLSPLSLYSGLHLWTPGLKNQTTKHMDNTTSSPIGGSTGGSMQANFQKTQNLFKQLNSAVSSGNMTQAGSLMTQIQNSAPQNPGAGGSSTVQQDFAALQSAISSGSATKAQAALQQLQSDMKAQQSSHHKRTGTAPAPTSTAAQPTSTEDEDSTSGSSSSSSSSVQSGSLNTEA